MWLKLADRLKTPLIGAACLLLGSFSVQAGDYLPQRNSSYDLNQSFLVDTQIGTETEESINEAVKQKIYGNDLSKKLTQEYLDMNRDFEFRERYGLNSSFSELEQGRKNSDFGRYIMRNVFSYQLTENMKTAEKNSNEGRMIKRTHDTVQTIVKSSTKWELADDFKFGTKTDLPSQRGRFWLRSSFVNADFDAVLGRGYSLNPGAQTSNAAATSNDHLYVSLNRELGIFGLMGGMSYGFNTTRMNHSITKSLAPNLSAEVASTRGVDPGKSGMLKHEESVRMTYGLRF